MPRYTQLEQELLVMLQNQRQATDEAHTELPDLPPELFGMPPATATPAPEPTDYFAFLNQPPVQEPEDHLSSLFAGIQPTSVDDDPLSGLFGDTTAASELEGLWSTTESAASAEAELESELANPLSALFMNGEARAAAEMAGVPLDSQDLSSLRSQPLRQSSDFEIQFDQEFDISAPAPPRTGRFRIDRPPPPPRPFNRTAASQDGQVVSSRGQDGRFRVEPVRRYVAPGEVVGRVASPPPHSASVPSRQPPEPPRAPVTTTAYDVIRKGGLDL